MDLEKIKQLRMNEVFIYIERRAAFIMLHEANQTPNYSLFTLNGLQPTTTERLFFLFTFIKKKKRSFIGQRTEM